MRILGIYDVVDELGTGGVGTVYRGRDLVLQRDIAIKTFPIGDADPGLKQRFFSEARAGGSLSHTSIATVFDIGEHEQTAYIAMEYLEGEDIGRFIFRRGFLPLESKINFMIEVCQGLAHAHENRIIHRDIKPGNLFLLKSGRAKILDFGISSSWASRLARGDSLGTSEYMAPEQIRGQEVDARSDLFSAAVVFFEFLVYTHPFKGRDVRQRILNEEPHRLRDVDAHIPESLEHLLSRALSKDPAARYQNGAEFIKALRKVSLEMMHQCSRMFQETLRSRERFLKLQSDIEDVLHTTWVRKTLEDKSVDLKVVKQITPESVMTTTSNLHYLNLCTLQEELEKTVAVLTDIAEEVAKFREGIKTARSLLRDGNINNASATLEGYRDRFPESSELGAALQEVQLHSLLHSLTQAVAGNDLAQASALLQEIESAAGSNPEAQSVVEAAKSKLAGAALAKDVLYKQAQEKIEQLREAVEARNKQNISSLLGALSDIEKALNRKYGTSSEEVMQLLSRCQKARRDAMGHIARVELRAAMDQGDLRQTQRYFRMLEEVYVNDPVYADTLSQIRDEVAGFELRHTRHEPLKGALSPEKEPSDLDALRKRIANLFQDNPEKCLSFIETLEPRLAKDPTVQSYYQQALQLRKDRSRETVLDQRKREPVPATQAQTYICPLCGAPNSYESTYCSQCYTRLHDARVPVSKRSARAPAVPGAREHHVRATSEYIRPSRSKYAKYYVAAVAVAAIIGLSGLVVFLRSGGGQAGIVRKIGTARVYGNKVDLQDHSGKVLLSLPGGTPVAVLDPLPERNMSHLAYVQVQEEKETKGAKLGYLRLGQLVSLEIEGNTEFTLWHAQTGFPDPGAADPDEFKGRLDFADKIVARYPEKAGGELLLKLAKGHALLVQRYRLTNPEDARREYANAQNYLNRLKSQPGFVSQLESIRQSLEVAAVAVAEPLKSPAAAPGPDFDKLFSEAQAAWDKGEPPGAVIEICDRILKMRPSHPKAMALRNKAVEAKKVEESVLGTKNPL